MNPTTRLKRTGPTTRERLRSFGEAALDLLFPPRCVHCHRMGEWLCASCVGMIEVIRPPLCPRCGLPIGAEPSATRARRLCPNCLPASSALEGARAYAWHRDPLRRAIHSFKYEDLRALAAPLADLMAQGWRTLQPAAPPLDAMVPVPLHSSRRRERGYDQAALLAGRLGVRLGLPTLPAALVRTRATRPQVGLNAHERQANVADAFACVEAGLQGARIMLIDDVFTTGATLEAAGSALRRGGAAAVWAYTLARAGQDPVNTKESAEWN